MLFREFVLVDHRFDRKPWCCLVRRFSVAHSGIVLSVFHGCAAAVIALAGRNHERNGVSAGYSKRLADSPRQITLHGRCVQSTGGTPKHVRHGNQHGVLLRPAFGTAQCWYHEPGSCEPRHNPHGQTDSKRNGPRHQLGKRNSIAEQGYQGPEFQPGEFAFLTIPWQKRLNVKHYLIIFVLHL